MASRRSRSLLAALCAAGVIGVITLVPARPEAHKAITSPYTYNEHVYPILRERCSRCHFPGGPTPMSLMSHADAIPWAESIREQLVGQKMPPWYPDRLGPAVKSGHALPTRELDILVTWAVGGTPRGDFSKDPPPFAPPVGVWPAGPPDVKLAMPAAHTLPPGVIEDTKTFRLPTGFTETRWVAAADLLPGEPSMVRDAIIAVVNGPVLAAWVPGDELLPAPSGAAFKVPAGATIELTVHYKKHWQDEQETRSDTSTVGLYLTDEPVSGRSLDALALEPAPSGDALAPQTFREALKGPTRILAVRPSFDRAYASVQIRALLPAGRAVPVLQLRAAQPQWYRRYWLAEPVELPAGTAIEVVATPAPKDDFAVALATRYPLRVALDIVAP